MKVDWCREVVQLHRSAPAPAGVVWLSVHETWLPG